MGDALFKQSNGMMAVNIVAACGVLTPLQLAGLAELARNCEVFRFKLTTRQTIIALLDDSQTSKLIDGLPDLGLAVAPYGNAVRAVKACAGSTALCPRALGDALDLGIAIQEKYLGRETPKDVKIAVAGCPRGCTDPYCADFGVVAKGADAFDIYLGGRGGSNKPVHGQLFVAKVSKADVLMALDHVLVRFTDLAQPKERLSSIVERLGLATFNIPEGLIHHKTESADNEFLDFLNTEGSAGE